MGHSMGEQPAAFSSIADPHRNAGQPWNPMRTVAGMEHECRVKAIAAQLARKADRATDTAMRALFLIEDHLVESRVADDHVTAGRADHHGNERMGKALAQRLQDRRGEDDIAQPIEPNHQNSLGSKKARHETGDRRPETGDGKEMAS